LNDGFVAAERSSAKLVLCCYKQNCSLTCLPLGEEQRIVRQGVYSAMENVAAERYLCKRKGKAYALQLQIGYGQSWRFAATNKIVVSELALKKWHPDVCRGAATNVW
jgi:hypothetical protein